MFALGKYLSIFDFHRRGIYIAEDPSSPDCLQLEVAGTPQVGAGEVCCAHAQRELDEII